MICIRILLFVSAFLICSCSGRRVENECTFDFQIDTVNIDLFSYCAIGKDSICIDKLIPLEASENSFIGGIDKMKIENNRIFILDKEVAKAILVFDMNGKYLYKIGAKGGGPGEFFRTPIDFSIDVSRKHIYVFEAELQKVYLFDWDGNYIEGYAQTSWPSAFAYIDSDNFAFVYRSKKDNFEFELHNKQGETIYQFLPLGRYLSLTKENPINCNENNVYFIPNLTTFALKMENNKFTSGIYLDFGKYNLPSKLKSNIKKGYNPDLLKNSNYVLGLQKVLESDDYLYICYNTVSVKMHYLLRKKDGMHYHGSSIFDFLASSDLQQIKGDSLITTIGYQQYESFQIQKKQMNKERINDLNPTSISTLLNSKLEADNPVVCILRIKNRE